LEHRLSNPVSAYLFRHGETNWNFELRWQGHSDIPLNQTGVQQAQQLALDLKYFGIQEIISSDLLRAKKTAEIVAQSLGVPLLFDNRLRETKLGMAEGLTNNEIIKTFGQDAWDRWARFQENDPLASFPQGESKPEVLKRVTLALEENLLKTKFQTIGISTHGGVLRRLIHSMRPDLTEPVMVPNCMCFQLEFSKQSHKLKWVADHPPISQSKTGPF
jgi:broad specificity phosphatase PhoE